MKITMTRCGLLSLGMAFGIVGCSETDKDDSSTPPDLVTDSGPGLTDCAGTAPVVEDVWCVNSGIQPHYETGEDTVTMQVWADTSDLDGDLTSYALQIFYDEEIDGSVDTGVANFSPVYGSVNRDDCSATDAELGLTLYLTGNDPDYDTLYDWGVVVTDAAGLQSDPTVVSCWSPASDGSDGGVE